MQKLKELFSFLFEKEYIDITPVSSVRPKKTERVKKVLPQKPKSFLKTFSLKKFKPENNPLFRKKKIVKKPAPKKILKAPKEILIGEVTHFFPKIGVGVIKVKCEMKVGDKMHIKGATTDFIQTIDSMQIDHQNVLKAPKGKEIGLKLKSPVRVGDEVFAH